jgi:recombination protein RecR
MHLLTDEHGLAQALATELSDIRSAIRPCETCRNWSEADADGHYRCAICRDTQRDSSLLCVVAKVQDLLALERSHVLKCRYFVLGQLLSPLDGIHAEDLPTDELAERVREDKVREVIIATPPGGDLEYSDQVTLGRALLGRRPLEPEKE